MTTRIAAPRSSRRQASAVAISRAGGTSHRLRPWSRMPPPAAVAPVVAARRPGIRSDRGQGHRLTVVARAAGRSLTPGHCWIGAERDTMRAVSRRAKIVCTLGPSTSTPEAIRDLVRAGMDVARLNFSHGEHAEHERIYRLVREAADSEGRAVGILADLQGPKIRLGTLRRRPADVGHGRDGHDHHRGRRGHPRPRRHHVQGPRRRRPSRRVAADRRRQRRPRGHRRRGPRRRLPRDRGRPGLATTRASRCRTPRCRCRR